MWTLGSLFDGIGGFPLAAVHNGIKASLGKRGRGIPNPGNKIHFPEIEHLGDITRVDGKNIPPVDIICGSSPCQDLSVAGKRKRAVRENGQDYLWTGADRKGDEGCRMVQEGISDDLRRPRYMVWGKCAGSIQQCGRGGRDFRAVIRKSSDRDCSCDVPRPDTGRWESAGAAILGKRCSVAWRVLDAQYWGSPQRRRRIFLVADFGRTHRPKDII